MKLLLIAFLAFICLAGCSSSSAVTADFNGDKSIRERRIESVTVNEFGDTVQTISEIITFRSNGEVLEFKQSNGAFEHHYDGEIYRVTSYSSISDTNFSQIAYQKQYNFNLHNYISEIILNTSDEASQHKTTFCYNSRLLPTEIKSVSEQNGNELFTKLSYVYLADSVLTSVVEDKKSSQRDSISHLRTSYEIDEQSISISMSIKNIVTGETNREIDSSTIPDFKDLQYSKPLTTEVFTSLFMDPLNYNDFTLIESELDDRGNLIFTNSSRITPTRKTEYHQSRINYDYW